MHRNLVLEKRLRRPLPVTVTIKHPFIPRCTPQVPRKHLNISCHPIPLDILTAGRLRMRTAERVALVTGLVLTAATGTLTYSPAITESQAQGTETRVASFSPAQPIPEITRRVATAAAAIEKEKPPLTIDIFRPFGDEKEFARFSKKIELTIKNGRVFAGKERVASPIFDDIVWRLRERKTALRNEFTSCRRAEMQWLRQNGYRIDRLTGAWFGRDEYGSTVYWIRGKKESPKYIYAVHQIQEITIKMRDGKCVPMRRQPYYGS